MNKKNKKTHKKWIVSVVGFDSEGGKDKVTFFTGKDKSVVPYTYYYSSEPNDAYLFNTKDDAMEFTGEFRDDTAVHEVSVTVDTTGVDVRVPVGVRIGDVITFEGKEYKITKIGYGRVQLVSVKNKK